jgi:EpsI family protein
MKNQWAGKMTNRQVGKWQVVLAAFAATLLVLLFDRTYRALAAQVTGTAKNAPVDPVLLERLPRQIGDWVGQDVPLDEEIRERTGADAIVNRQYTRRNGLEAVGLYIASGVSARSFVDHRPEVCFISSGWTLMDRRPTELPLADGSRLPCSIFQFSRGMLDTERTVVLHYYIVDGRHCGDVSSLRQRVWRGSHMVDYATQVQVVVSAGTMTTAEWARELACAFAADAASSVLRLFEDREGRPEPLGVASVGFRGAAGEE